MTVALVIAAVIALAVEGLHLPDTLRYFQSLEYNTGRFFRWTPANVRRLTWPIEALCGVLLIATALLPSDAWIVAAGAAFWVVATLAARRLATARRPAATKPLAYTARARRILGVAALLLAGVALVVLGLAWGFRAAPWLDLTVLVRRTLPALGIITLLGQLPFLNIPLSNALLSPVEAAIQEWYTADARKRLRKIHPYTIGITGSYGKTSTKEILAHLLSARYEVLKTPRSYNTIAGVCRVARQDLQPRHQYFVVELGAYKAGEIARICRLVQPSLGILTAVGPQHLERFRTIEAVARAKNELLQALPSDGIAIVNGDDPICRRLGDECTVPVRRYGLEPAADLDLRAESIRIGADGTRFELVQQGKPPQPARTLLLGRHNVSNVLAAALAAIECGLSLREIAQALATLPPVEHRLQLVPGAEGIVTIDDAYNSNPMGAAMALEVLAAFPGRKILVTPGMVELGPAEVEENRLFGRLAAASCDLVYLVGSARRVDAIAEGLAAAGFAADRVIRAASLNEARAHLREVVRKGDAVLFENDLPDVY